MSRSINAVSKRLSPVTAQRHSVRPRFIRGTRKLWERVKIVRIVLHDESACVSCATLDALDGGRGAPRGCR